ncbi:MAG: trypsin-like peptidase domain-containing protein [Actinomycetota bacterium]|nr:trypsin-like peptidase domain-containing protein [Actinomycetota bacterium]
MNRHVVEDAARDLDVLDRWRARVTADDVDEVHIADRSLLDSIGHCLVARVVAPVETDLQWHACNCDGGQAPVDFGDVERDRLLAEDGLTSLGRSDLALLDVPTLTAPPLGIGTARVGPATLITWRRSDGVTHQLVGVTRLLKINIEDIYTDEVVQRTGLEFDGDVIVGQSGGPVVNASGEVIGIIYATSKDRKAVGFATDDTELRELIADRSVGGVANGQCP